MYFKLFRDDLYSRILVKSNTIEFGQDLVIKRVLSVMIYKHNTKFLKFFLLLDRVSVVKVPT